MNSSDSPNTASHPDAAVINDQWSSLAAIREMPEIDTRRLRHYRLERIRAQMRARDVALTILVNPLSLRYAVDFREFTAFQARIPLCYLFVPLEGPVVMHSGFSSKEADPDSVIDEFREPYDINIYNAGSKLTDQCRLFSLQVLDFLKSIQHTGGRVAVDQVTPAVVQALMQQGMEVLDAVSIVEDARLIKSVDEIQCMRWSVAVAEHGMAKLREVLAPGVTEHQLWALMNYVNLANDGEWHDLRMLASGPRTNPWFQEASSRAIGAGELVAFDTDMVGPFGYFCDVSRTYFCEPGKPTDEQRELYTRAYDEINHNIAQVRVGMTLQDLAERAFRQPAGFLRYSVMSPRGRYE